MKTYNQFINESVRDLMKPKPWDDVEKNMPPQLVKLYDEIPYEKKYQFYSADDDNKEDKVKIFVKLNYRIVWILWKYDIEKYAILDDDNDMLPEQMPFFFQTTWAKGLTPEITQKIINFKQ